MLNKLAELKRADKLPPNLVIYLLIGPPGAGKDILGRIIQALMSEITNNFVLKVMSKMLQTRAQKEDELGRLVATQIRTKIPQGKLVDDEPTMAVLEENILANIATGKRQIMLDGSIRTPEQAKALIATNIQHQTFYIYVPPEISVARIQKRAQEQGRVDDIRPEVIMERLRIMERKTPDATRILKDYAPPRFRELDGMISVKTNISTILSLMGYNRQENQQMMSRVSRPKHPANDVFMETLRQTPSPEVHLPELQQPFPTRSHSSMAGGVPARA